MAKLTPPISVAKVSTTLGVTSGDVGTLCTSSKINKASLRKPTWVGLNPTQMCNKDTYGKKPDGNYIPVGFGLFVPYVDGDFTKLKDGLDNKLWYHSAPTTANDNYKNLAHFDGYVHSVTDIQVVQVTIKAGQKIAVSFGYNNADGVIDLPLIPLLTDISDPYYFGVAVYKGANKELVAVGVDDKSIREWGTLNREVRTFILGDAESNTDYKVVPFITNYSYEYFGGAKPPKYTAEGEILQPAYGTIGDVPVGCRFHSVNILKSEIVSVRTTSDSLYTTDMVIETNALDSNGIDVWLRIKNNMSAPMNITNGKLTITDTSKMNVTATYNTNFPTRIEAGATCYVKVVDNYVHLNPLYPFKLAVSGVKYNTNMPVDFKTVVCHSRTDELNPIT